MEVRVLAKTSLQMKPSIMEKITVNISNISFLVSCILRKYTAPSPSPPSALILN